MSTKLVSGCIMHAFVSWFRLFPTAEKEETSSESFASTNCQWCDISDACYSTVWRSHRRRRCKKDRRRRRGRRGVGLYLMLLLVSCRLCSSFTRPCHQCIDRVTLVTNCRMYRVQALSAGVQSAKRSCTVLHHTHATTRHHSGTSFTFTILSQLEFWIDIRK